MSAEPLLSFDDLLQPIAGENPAGEPLSYELRQELDEERREVNPDAFAPDDPMRPDKPKPANWSGIIRKTTEALRTTSKDLLITTRLLEALTKLHGFAGLRDGLHLLALLVGDCWERLNPPIEDGDVEVRLGPFTWIDDPDRGARFPTTVRLLPLIRGPEESYGWLQWKACQDGHGPVSAGDMDKAIQATSVDFLRSTAAAVGASVENLNALTENLNAKMGSSAPGLTGVRQALEGCRVLAEQLLKLRGADLAGALGAAVQPGATDGAAGAAAPGLNVGEGAVRAAATREEAYRQLEQAAALLERLEPHSPIPYFVRRAVQLGKLPYPLLMRELIRDANVLNELNREMGIKDDGSVSSAAPSAG
jgi:type VI secretion system protein ImpA